MKKCNTCFYQEKLYNGSLICQHIQSVHGMEAYEQYKLCDEIVKFYFYKKTNFRCSECSGNCYTNQTKNKCNKWRLSN